MFLKNKNIFLYIPILFLNFLFFVSFILLFIQTVNSDVTIYYKILKNEAFYDSLLYGLEISFFTITCSLFFYFILYFLLFLLRFKYSKDIKNYFFFLSIPLLIPYSFCALLFFMLFFPVGVFQDIFPFLVGTSTAVVIAYVYKIISFFLLVSFPNLMKISNEQINLHKMYSSNSFHFFWNIVIKRDLKLLYIAIFIVFAYILNAYEIPSILGSNTEKMPAVYVSELLGEFGINSLNIAYATSFVYFFVTLCFIPILFISYKISKKVFF